MESSRYAGDVSLNKAWDMLVAERNAVLVDVRTPEEWNSVGLPDLSTLDKDALCLSWRVYPQMSMNENFMAELVREVKDKNAALLFLCRSGGRSREAAIEATSHGYTRCYNVAAGFEGKFDQHSGSNTVNGWKVTLPWRQN